MDQLSDETRTAAATALGKQLGIRFGLGTALAMIGYSLFLHFGHVPQDSWLNYLVLPLFFLGVWVFCRAYSKSQDYLVSFKDVFKAGFRMVAFTTVMMIAWGWVSAWVFPEMKELALEATRQQLTASGLPETEIEKTMAQTRDKYLLIGTMTLLFSNVFYGVVFCLISAGIVKKKKA